MGEKKIQQNLDNFKRYSAVFDLKRDFHVVKKFIRKCDDIESTLQAQSATEGLQMTSTNVYSCVETTKEALTLKYSLDLGTVFVGYTDGTIRSFNTQNMQLGNSLDDKDVLNNGPVTSIKLRPIGKNAGDNSVIHAAYSSGFVKCWDLKSKKAIYTINESRQIFSMNFHPKLKKFLTAGDDGNICLYDEESRVQERVFKSSENTGKLDGHSLRVFCVCFNPTSNYEFISGGWDNVVHFWDVRQQNSIRHISNVHMCGEGLDVSPNGKEVLTCAWQEHQPLNIWNYETGKIIQQIDPDIYQSKLYCGKYISPEYIVTGGSDDNLFRLVHLQTYSTAGHVNNLPGAVYSIDVGPIRKLKKERIRSHLLELPMVAVSAGKKIFQFDFGT